MRTIGRSVKTADERTDPRWKFGAGSMRPAYILIILKERDGERGRFRGWNSFTYPRLSIFRGARSRREFPGDNPSFLFLAGSDPFDNTPRFTIFGRIHVGTHAVAAVAARNHNRVPSTTRGSVRRHDGRGSF